MKRQLEIILKQILKTIRNISVQLSNIALLNLILLKNQI